LQNNTGRKDLSGLVVLHSPVNLTGHTIPTSGFERQNLRNPTSENLNHPLYSFLKKSLLTILPLLIPAKTREQTWWKRSHASEHQKQGKKKPKIAFHPKTIRVNFTLLKSKLINKKGRVFKYPFGTP